MQFESVLGMQRYRQDKLNAECEGYLPEFKTPLALERHIARVFTITIFYELQKEIEAACFDSFVVGLRHDGDSTYYDIGGAGNITSTVHYKASGQVKSCNCNLFQRMGLVCRHMFVVFRGAQMEQLPPDYIVGRWCKHLDYGACRGVPPNGDRPTPTATQLCAEINTCVGMVGNSLERQTRMVSVLKDLTIEFTSDDLTVNHVKGNRTAIQALCGVEPPKRITILAPAQAKNKGTGKRIKSNREMAIEKSSKPGRKCGICGKYAQHNACSCPSK
ncbi:PREDICTED: protein FAR1-RELATED SEQUENCE 9-like [Ipomoea nil]|uniref:protein FAR1-RELATED SEQUENCE 9-like n=1 Tax=Ipomoea nil TaxID=35883 RepID=UPI000900AAEF|nr:PREDICTED: protein FAR1-RELATED SEQUENCE 9-like [Ipomoea nil]